MILGYQAVTGRNRLVAAGPVAGWMGGRMSPFLSTLSKYGVTPAILEILFNDSDLSKLVRPSKTNRKNYCILW